MSTWKIMVMVMVIIVVLPWRMGIWMDQWIGFRRRAP